MHLLVNIGAEIIQRASSINLAHLVARVRANPAFFGSSIKLRAALKSRFQVEKVRHEWLQHGKEIEERERKGEYQSCD